MNKRVLVIVGIVAALLIAVPYLLILRGIASERQQQAALEERIEILEAGLTGQGEGGAGLVTTRQAELATAQAELAAAQFAFPSEMDNTGVVAYILSTAGGSGATILRVEARDPLTATIGSGAYIAFAYDVEVEGELDALNAFIAALESGPIETLIVDQIRLESRTTPQPPYRASLVVQVYVRGQGSESGSQ